LTARAFGADEVILAGEEDPSALETWNSVTEKFGGDFECRYEAKPMGWLRRFSKNGTVIHLTMYGEPWREAVESIPRDAPVVVVVGGTKVPGEIFRIADHNVSIGNQPHSEVAALAVFLESWMGPINESIRFAGGEIEVVPSERAKRVRNSVEE
jgi:tRNA (cytidine56-2'-O)-methyltransferase